MISRTCWIWKCPPEKFLCIAWARIWKNSSGSARHGSIEILKRCMNYGVEVNIPSTYGMRAIVEAASQGHDHVIEWLLEPWVKSARPIEEQQHSEKLNLPQGWLYPSLHKAIEGQHVSAVKLLVENARADVNACGNDNSRPLHVAAKFVDQDNPEQISRYEEIVEILVTAGARVNDRNPLTDAIPLYDAVSLNSGEATKRLLDGEADVFIPCTETKTTVLHVAAAAGSQEMLRTMLDHDRLSGIDPCDFDLKDEDGLTPLHAAVYGGHLECVRILIEKGLSLANMTKAGETVADAIFKKVSHPIDFLAEILDKQVSFADESYEKVDLDFRIITARASVQSPGSRIRSISDLDVVFALIKAVRNKKQLTILQHPLLMTLLAQKYFRILIFAIPLFICEVFTGIIFIAHITCIMTPTSESSVCDFVGTSVDNGVKLVAAIAALSICDIFGFSLETFGRVYFRHKSVLLKQVRMLVLRGAAILVIYLFMDISRCEIPPCEYEPLELSLIAIEILAYWIYIFLICQQFPFAGECVHMFGTVLTTVLKVLGIFVCLIIGFIFSFAVLLSHTDAFNTPWKAFVKTMVMMTGEFEYGDIFTLTNVNNVTVDDSTSDDHNDTFPLVVSQIVLLLFVLFVSIVLMNLMLGLAVSDVEKLLKDSRSLRLKNQAEAATQWRGLRYLHSLLSTYLGRQPTKPTSSITQVDLKSTFLVSWFEISADVKSALYDLALKNSFRAERPHPESPRDNIQEDLAAIRSSLATMQSSIEKLIAEQQRQDFPMVDRRSQDQMATTRHMDSLNSIDAY